MWIVGGWTKFDLLSVAAVVDGELRSRVRGAWGCCPGRWAIGDAFISSVWVSVYCDFSQSLLAMGFLLIWRRWRNGDGFRWLSAAAGGIGLWRIPKAEGPGVLNVILLSFRVLSVKHPLPVYFSDVLVFSTGLCIVSLTSI